MNKYIKPLILVVAFLILSLVTVASFAYFTASVNGNSNAYDTVITTGQMALVLNDGEQISLNNAIPGDSIVKEFSVKNTGTVETTYDVYFSELLNEFEDKNDLVYTLISENGCSDGSEKMVPSISSDESKMVNACAINPNQTHNYTLTITFKNDETNQDDNKGKVFFSRISINEWKEYRSNIAHTIIGLKAHGALDLEYDGTETLGTYGTPDNNLRYVGNNPNNYVYFNCSTTDSTQMNDDTCEKWRIIGLMNNVEDKNSNKGSYVKIMRNESLGEYSWDSSNSSINSGNGINQWGAIGTYEGADLMRELNNDYLGNVIVGMDGKWYNDGNDSKTADMPANVLTLNAQDMIEEINWNIGANAKSEYRRATKVMYDYERSGEDGKQCRSGDSGCDDEAMRTTRWTGKVGLIYPSDYGYSTSGGVTTNKEVCLDTLLKSWGYSNVKDCKINSWIFKQGKKMFTLMPYGDNYSSYCVFGIDESGSVSSFSADLDRSVYPTLFLKSNITIVSGDGSELNPYKIAMY